MNRETVTTGALVLTVVFHYAVVLGNATAFLVLPFREPWYVALPVCSFLMLQFSTPVECPLTKLENVFREKLGKPRVRGFIGHYVLKPTRKVLGRKRQSYPTGCGESI